MSKEEILENGTNEYVSVRYSIYQYLQGNCPMNDVEAAIKSAMDEFANQRAIEVLKFIAGFPEKQAIELYSLYKK